MRKRTFISLMAALILATGCVYDTLAPEAGCERGKYYLALVLHPQGESGSATKADEGSPSAFANAALSEMLIAHADVFFYDADGSYLEKHHLVGLEYNTATGNPSVEAQAGYQLITLDHRPYRMLVAANLRDEDVTALTGKTVAQAQALVSDIACKWDSSLSVDYEVDGTPGSATVNPFPMTSGTWLSNAGQVISDVAVPEANLKETAAKAAAAPMEVYIERLAAKVTLRLSALEYKVPAVTAVNNISTRVEVLGWGLNATNKTAYLFKNIRTSWGSDFSWSWNSAAHRRSYWAQDPNYDSGSYPVKAADITAGDALDYVSYNGLGGSLVLDGSGYYSGSLYCRENTADGPYLPLADDASATLYSRITHVLVKARLVFSLASGADTEGYTTATDIYRYNGVFYATDAAALAAQTAYPGGTVECFKNKIMYYKIPVEHLNNDVPASGTSYNTGNYGVVRNHNYTLTVEGLSGIGTAVPDQDEPIVPIRTPGDYQLSAYITVSPWRQLVQEFVFVDPSGAIQTNGQQIETWTDTSGWYE